VYLVSKLVHYVPTVFTTVKQNVSALTLARAISQFKMSRAASGQHKYNCFSPVEPFLVVLEYVLGMASLQGLHESTASALLVLLPDIVRPFPRCMPVVMYVVAVSAEGGSYFTDEGEP